MEKEKPVLEKTKTHLTMTAPQRQLMGVVAMVVYKEMCFPITGFGFWK